MICREKQSRFSFNMTLIIKVRNLIIREIMEVGKNILEVTEENSYCGLDM
jgi:hypothetical protein